MIERMKKSNHKNSMAKSEFRKQERKSFFSSLPAITTLQWEEEEKVKLLFFLKFTY